MKQILSSFKLAIVFAVVILLLSFAACTTDCVWYDTAKAWIDENENGVWDSNEQPLAGVRFVVDDIRNAYPEVGEAISDEQGKAQLTVSLPGCPTVEFEISAQPPEGYQATTPSRVSVSQDALKRPGSDEFVFGFVAK